MIKILTAEYLHTPVAINDRVKIEHPGIGLVTIYRTLEILEELGLICETHAGRSCRSHQGSGIKGEWHL